MRFPKLEIENFLAITKAEINLADRGLLLVQGKNNADTSAVSNGAGKSSIADALCWCWYGVTARGASGDDIINDKAGKNCRVTSVVEDGGITYTASRHRKHKDGKNSLRLKMFDGFKETDLTKGTDKLTQEVANQIIGSSLEVFAGSIYAGQERMPDLPAMTDRQLKTLIEEAAGVTVLEAAYELARKKATEVGNTLTLAQSRLSNAQDLVNHGKASLTEAEADRGAWGMKQTTRIAALEASIKMKVPVAKNLAAQMKKVDIETVRAEIARIDAKIASVGEEQRKLTALQHEVATTTAAVSRLADDAKRTQQTVAVSQKALTDINHKVGCPCDECGRPLTAAELAAATAAAKSRYDAAENDLTDIKARYVTAREAQKRAQEARDAYAAAMTDVSAEQASRAALAAQERDYETLRQKGSAALAEIKSITEMLERLKTETNPLEETVERCKKALQRAEAQRDQIKTEIASAEKAVAIAQEVVKVYGPAGVRARILDEVTPFLNTQTMKYLATLSDSNLEAVWTTLTPAANGSLKEKFSIDVTNATGGKKFALISGGEKRKVRIATALALQDLVATRATKPIDLFIGDEIDDALDSAGLERLTTILEEKARERGTVLIISHSDIKDFVRQVMVIEKTASGETRISELAA